MRKFLYLILFVMTLCVFCCSCSQKTNDVFFTSFVFWLHEQQKTQRVITKRIKYKNFLIILHTPSCFQFLPNHLSKTALSFFTT